MRISRRRVVAVLRKELRDLRRSGNVVTAMVVLPLVFLIPPIIQVFAVPSSGSAALHHEHTSIYLLAIPALVPSALSAYSIVGERMQDAWNDPVHPGPGAGAILGKALAVFVPSVSVRLCRLRPLHRHRGAVRGTRRGSRARPGSRCAGPVRVHAAPGDPVDLDRNGHLGPVQGHAHGGPAVHRGQPAHGGHHVAHRLQRDSATFQVALVAALGSCYSTDSDGGRDLDYSTRTAHYVGEVTRRCSTGDFVAGHPSRGRTPRIRPVPPFNMSRWPRTPRS